MEVNDNLVDEPENNVDDEKHLKSDDYATPRKKKKKEKGRPEGEDTTGKNHKEISNNENENGIVVEVKEHSILVELNSSSIKDKTSLKSSQKKKRKIADNEKNNGNMSVNAGEDTEVFNTSTVESEIPLITPTKRKKKKECSNRAVITDSTITDNSSKALKKKAGKGRFNDITEKNGEDREEHDHAEDDEIPRLVKKMKTYDGVEKVKHSESKKKDKRKIKKSKNVLPDEGPNGQLNGTAENDFDAFKGTEEGSEDGGIHSGSLENLDNENEEFTLIDAVKQVERPQVHRVLPDWLANPTFVSMNLADGIEVSEMQGLQPFLKKILKQRNIQKFFPVQAAVIPELLASTNTLSMRYRPRDICVSAPTGSGKTLAYVLPILQALSNRVVPQLRAVILLPTQELARQVHDVIAIFTKFLKLKVSLAVGGRSLKKEQGTLLFRDTQGDCAADILVATPGKLSDHVNYTDKLSLKYLRYLVMDEADLFSSSSGGSFMVQVEKLLKAILKPTPDNSIICGGFQPRGSVYMPEYYLQKILISATLMHDPEQLKVFNLYQPKLFSASNLPESADAEQTIGPYIRPEEVKEEYIIVDPNKKPLVLYHLINTSKLKRVLVFTKSKQATHNLAIVLSALSKKLTVAEFSSNKANRRKVLEEFNKKRINVLVSSDAMARGIDIRGIQQVVSYDVPSVQTYVHRCGRTGRAGRVGYSLCMVEATDEAKGDFRHIQRSCKDRLTRIHVNERSLEGYGNRYQAALDVLKETIQEEKIKKRMKKGVKGPKEKKSKSVLKGKFSSSAETAPATSVA